MRETAASNGTQALTLLARAAAFHALAQALSYPAPGHKQRVEAELDRIVLGARSAADAALSRALAGARRAWARADEEALQAEYGRLFLGGGCVVARETAYGDGQRLTGRTHELADISGFYSAFGMQLTGPERDSPDHLCPQLEFYSVMLVKLAYAGNTGGWSSRREITRRALKKFLEQHLGRWVAPLAAEVRNKGAGSPYRELIALASRLVAREARRLRVRPAPRSGKLPHDFMQDDAFACPHASRAAAAAT